ncbi:internal head protein [Pseudomonas phage PhiPA3]|uniref:Virion structural protein n=1 Tax=Pseudomonas phage PhiPA3 TaxID=998086 RepID=F8SJX7_BPPA3|nr:internal head protein [Pseudomonas phage PhiPA3]AEH03524.1 virion structural protein [Pseudomonas phage PhiPA3]
MSSALQRYLSQEEYDEAPVPTDVVVEGGDSAIDAQEVEVIAGPTPAVVEGAIEPTPITEVLPEPTPAPLPETPAVVTNTEMTPVAEVTTDIPAGAEQEVDIAVDQGLPPTGEEILDVEAAVDNDSTLPMMDHSQIEQTIIANQVDDMIEVQQSMEAYAALLKQTGLEGISQQTAAFLRVGLKDAERKLGVTGLVAGLESYDATPRSAIQKATVSTEDLKAYAKQAFEKVMELIRKLLAAIASGFESLMSGIVETEHKLNLLEQAAEQLRGKEAPNAVVPLNDPLLFAGTKLKFKDTKSLSGLAHFSSYAYPAAVKKYYEGLGTLVKGWDPIKGNADDLVEKLTSATAPLDDLYSDNEILPGNMVIDIAADGIVYGLRKDETQDDQVSGKLTVRSVPEIKQHLKKLSDIIKINKAAKAEHEKIAEGAKTLTDAGKALEAKLGSAELDPSSKAEIQKVLNTIADLVRTSNPRSKQITHYVIRVVSAHLKVIKAELSSYTKKTGE